MNLKVRLTAVIAQESETNLLFTFHLCCFGYQELHSLEEKIN